MEITKSDITKHESTAIPIGLINLDKKLIGKRNAGNPPVAFDEEGAGNTIKTCACSRPYYRRSTLNGRMVKKVWNQKSSHGSDRRILDSCLRSVDRAGI